MKKIASPPQRKQLKPVRNRVKTKPRSDPFQRALAVARKKYDRAENELALAREKIARLEEELPGLQSVIHGLENYFGEEPSFGMFDARRVVLPHHEHREEISSSPPDEPLPPRPKKAPKPPKPGTAALYVCNKCGGFTATTDFPPLCSNEACMSRDLILKEVKGPNLTNPNGGGAMVVDAGLPSAQVDDDPLPTDLPGRQILP